MKNMHGAVAATLVAGLFVTSAAAQKPAGQAAPAPPQGLSASAAVPAPSVAAPDFASALPPIEQAAQSTIADLGRLRIEKWKTDSNVKQQSQANADSIQRNLSAALPSLVQQSRNAPGSLASGFKLYRNLNAVYEVLASLTESAGAFGQKSEFQALSTDLASLDQSRRALADRLEQTTSSADSELNRLRAQSRALQAAAAAAAQPPKKIVVDDTEPEKKPAKKKTAPAAPRNQ